MNLLLDTHILLWLIADDPKLSAAAKVALADPANTRWLSPISLLEIAIKVQLKKLPLAAPFGSLFPMQLTVNHVQLIPLELRHIEPLTTMPRHHKDPFDRLIAATALVEKLTLVSVDPVFDVYGLTRLW
jgi:PIN domain nuclease of toxin-antitoxin system